MKNGIAAYRWLGPLALVATILATLGLAGCASEPEAPVVHDPRPDTEATAHLSARPQPSDYERLLAGRAVRAEAVGRWADAVLAWEVLTVLRPQDSRLAERLAATRQRIEALARERLAAAVQAQKRGELDLAVQAYLEVLALDPERHLAADALRQIERERTRRSVGGRFTGSPTPAARRAATPRTIAPDTSAARR